MVWTSVTGLEGPGAVTVMIFVGGAGGGVCVTVTVLMEGGEDAGTVTVMVGVEAGQGQDSASRGISPKQWKRLAWTGTVSAKRVGIKGLG